MSEVRSPEREIREQSLGRTYEGWAFTFCKAAFLMLLLGKHALLITSGLATVFYVLASLQGVREWRCFAKPPWVTLFWGAVFVGQCWHLYRQLFFAHSP
jgi:hypothetical protein